MPFLGGYHPLEKCVKHGTHILLIHRRIDLLSTRQSNLRLITRASGTDMFDGVPRRFDFAEVVDQPWAGRFQLRPIGSVVLNPV